MTLKTKTKDIVALPYNFEVHDIVMMALQHNTSNEFYNRAMAYHQCLDQEADGTAKIMSIAVHPYLSGSPHRFGDVARTYSELLAKAGVLCWDGERILDWYKGERGQ